jgi:hypothetical protein
MDGWGGVMSEECGLIYAHFVFTPSYVALGISGAYPVQQCCWSLLAVD